MNLDEFTFDVIVGTLQLVRFLDTGRTLMCFTAALGVVLVVAGLLGVAHARIAQAPKQGAP